MQMCTILLLQTLEPGLGLALPSCSELSEGETDLPFSLTNWKAAVAFTSP